MLPFTERSLEARLPLRDQEDTRIVVTLPWAIFPEPGH
jgi:hypothetical protein